MPADRHCRTWSQSTFKTIIARVVGYHRAVFSYARAPLPDVSQIDSLNAANMIEGGMKKTFTLARGIANCLARWNANPTRLGNSLGARLAENQEYGRSVPMGCAPPGLLFNAGPATTRKVYRARLTCRVSSLSTMAQFIARMPPD